MPKRRKKAAPAKAAKTEPRKLQLLGRRIGVEDELSLHWLNIEGDLTPLDVINDFGIREIYKQVWSAPEESFPKPTCRQSWLKILREYAQVRRIELPRLEDKDSGEEFVSEGPDAAQA